MRRKTKQPACFTSRMQFPHASACRRRSLSPHPLGPDRVAILHAIRASVSRWRTQLTVRARSRLRSDRACTYRTPPPIAARCKRSDQRCPTGERSEHTQPDASEAITVIAPLGQTQFESCFRLVSRKLRARSPRVAVLLHHQPRALLFLQLRRANEPGRTPLRPRRQNPRLLEQLRKRRLSRIHVVRARRHFEAHPSRLHGRRVAEDDFFVDAAPANDPRGA